MRPSTLNARASQPRSCRVHSNILEWNRLATPSAVDDLSFKTLVADRWDKGTLTLVTGMPAVGCF